MIPKGVWELIIDLHGFRKWISMLEYILVSLS